MQEVQHLRRETRIPPQLAAILPLSLCDAVERSPFTRVEELRLHKNRHAAISCGGRHRLLPPVLDEREIHHILQEMCGGSLYAHTQTINQGYLTLPGGIRVGICGSAAMEHGHMIGVGEVSGLVIRIPHAPAVSVSPLIALLDAMKGLQGILIYAPPGVGKTTLLRALAREAAGGANGRYTVAVDTREELAPWLEGEELLLDVLVGYPRDLGIEIALRSLGAQLILCDEIGNLQDAGAALQAANSGVPLIATTHARSVAELLRKPMIGRLHRARVFGAYVGLVREKNGFGYRIRTWEEANAVGAEAFGMSADPDSRRNCGSHDRSL